MTPPPPATSTPATSTPARTCGVCAAPVRPLFQAPPPELAPDLDLRPGEPTRSTLPRWVATCRQCGLSAPDLACPPAGSRDAVRSEPYRALAGPGPERAFLRHAVLAEAAGEPAEAANAVLQAAWTRDDAGRDATALRRRAATLWAGGATMQDSLRVVDVLRRAGDHPAAAAQVARLLARPDLEETDHAILTYQQTLIAAGDTERHLMSSALRPPAQRPHVTHGQAPRPMSPRPSPSAPRSLWQRLTGR